MGKHKVTSIAPCRQEFNAYRYLALWEVEVDKGSRAVTDTMLDDIDKDLWYVLDETLENVDISPN